MFSPVSISPFHCVCPNLSIEQPVSPFLFLRFSLPQRSRRLALAIAKREELSLPPSSFVSPSLHIQLRHRRRRHCSPSQSHLSLPQRSRSLPLATTKREKKTLQALPPKRPVISNVRASQSSIYLAIDCQPSKDAESSKQKRFFTASATRKIG
ncbi:hypothetical protein AAC387_Pa10g0208 [Persea americana]